MRIPLPVLPLPFLFLLSVGCAQDHALDLSPENQDSATVADLAGVWCSETSNLYAQLELSPPSDSERRDEGTFRSIGPIQHSEDVSISPIRLIQSGIFYAYDGTMQFKVQEERVWSDATGKIAETFTTVDKTIHWNYRKRSDWNDADIYDHLNYYLALESTDSSTHDFELSRHEQTQCDLELDQ